VTDGSKAKDEGITVEAEPGEPGSVETGPVKPGAVTAGCVTLGRITAHYGLNGWVKVHSDTHPRENITRFRSWILLDKQGERVVEVEEGRAQGKTIVVRLAGVTTREAAALLINCDIAVPRTTLPSLAHGEHYWADLIGLDVVNTDGCHYGKALRLFDTGANDVLVVRDEREGRENEAEILIPWVRPDVILEVNLQESRIRVDWDPDY